MPDADQLAPPVAFFYLAVDQTCRHLPSEDSAPLATHLEPVPKMSRQRIKVEIEALFQMLCFFLNIDEEACFQFPARNTPI